MVEIDTESKFENRDLTKDEIIIAYKNSYEALVEESKITDNKVKELQSEIEKLEERIEHIKNEIDRALDCYDMEDEKTIRDRLLELAYPDGPAGDAGVSARKYLELKGLISKLLAIINRDNGRYEAEHGMAEAIVEAERLIIAERYKTLERVQELEANLERCKAMYLRDC